MVTLCSSGAILPANASLSDLIPGECSITALKLGASGKLYTAASDKVRIWDLRTFSCLGRLSGGHQAAVMCLTAWEGPNNTDLVATGSKDHYVKVFEVNSRGGTVPPLLNLEPPHYDGVQALVVAKDATGVDAELFSGSRAGQIGLPQDASEHLINLCVQGDFPHLMFYGPSGAGKKTRSMYLLRELYGPGNYHIEVNHSDAGIHDRVDQLTKDAQHVLRRTMEEYVATCRLLCVNSTSRNSICKKEGLDIPPELATRITQKSDYNLRRAILMLEACKVQQYPFTVGQDLPEIDWQVFFRKMANQIVQEQSPQKLETVCERCTMMPSGTEGSGPQQQQAPLPPQFRALMPPFRIATISVGRFTLEHDYQRREFSSAAASFMEPEIVVQRSIIQDEDLLHIEVITKDEGAWPRTQVDYNQKLQFSDDESESSPPKDMPGSTTATTLPPGSGQAHGLKS
ncbi:hypothetical protein pipiens_014473 [Culex pipiens pipiens]|uniref:Uncharacterized protein n=1 Tax=Culex pipiens pipiens TaxID=38569 RepID=A0ABD1CUG5_CULPP